MYQNPIKALANPEEGYLEWKNWDFQHFSQFSTQDDAYFTAEFELIQQGNTKPRVLELGFGNGRFLGWCLSQQFDYCGIETNPELVKRAREKGVPAYDSVSDPEMVSQVGQFDCVVAIDVFEHVPQQDLPGLLSNLSRLLATGGHVIARFPNGDSPFGRVYQHGDRTHCTTIGRFKMIQFANLAGFEVIEIRAPMSPSRGLSLIESLKREIGLWARALIERSCAHLYFSGQHVSFAPNYVAVLRKSSNVSRSE
jgi:SAM-dependent methyltransferase